MWPVISQRVPVRDGARGVRAHVGAALLLGHRHAHERAVVVARPRHPRLPLGRHVRLLAQRRDRRVGHRDRAHHARVHLAPDEEERGAHDVAAGLRVPPGERVDLALDRLAQAPVPGRVELDLVHALAVAVVRAQDRLVALGRARSAPAPRRSRPARRCRAACRRPSLRPRAPAPRAAGRPPRRRCRGPAAAPGSRQRACCRRARSPSRMRSLPVPGAQPSLGCRVPMRMNRLLPLTLITLLLVVPSAHAARGFSLGVTAGEVTAKGAILWGKANKSGRYALDDRAQQGASPGTTRGRGCARGSRTTTPSRSASGASGPARATGSSSAAGPAEERQGHLRDRSEALAEQDHRVRVQRRPGLQPGARRADQPFWNNGPVLRQMKAERNAFNVMLGDTIYSDSEVPGRLNPIALSVRAEVGEVQGQPRQPVASRACAARRASTRTGTTTSSSTTSRRPRTPSTTA